jgi:hypothetical protein
MGCYRVPSLSFHMQVSGAAASASVLAAAAAAGRLVQARAACAMDRAKLAAL